MGVQTHSWLISKKLKVAVCSGHIAVLHEMLFLFAASLFHCCCTFLVFFKYLGEQNTSPCYFWRNLRCSATHTTTGIVEALTVIYRLSPKTFIRAYTWACVRSGRTPPGSCPGPADHQQLQAATAGPGEEDLQHSVPFPAGKPGFGTYSKPVPLLKGQRSFLLSPAHGGKGFKAICAFHTLLWCERGPLGQMQDQHVQKYIASAYCSA